MVRIKFLFILLITASASAFGQGHKIEVNLKPAAGKDLILANYYLGNIYAKDTIHLDNNGHGAFAGDTLLPQGIYKMFVDQDENFDLLLGADQQFIITNPEFESQTMKVAGSKELEAFADYMVFLRNLQNKGAELREKLKSASGAEKDKLQKEMESLTPQLHDYWAKIENELPNSFLAKFVKANYVPALDVSTLPKEIQNNDSLLLLAKFYYQREHYWDNFDYTDERFLYTPFYKPKLETWFNKVLYQSYDSVKPYVFNFIEEVRPHKRIFQFAASWFLNSSINSNIMGMDALFVDLAREYYLSGEAFWTTEESMDKIEENVLFSEKNLIGMTAPDLTLESVDGEYFNLHQVDAPYTVLLIYEPNCSHCQIFVPEFHEKVYEKYKSKGLKVYSIYSMDDKEEWVEFLTKHDMYDWINVWDKDHISRFKILYDARKTPGVYVLDENKKIVAKKMTVEQLDKFMEQNLN